MNYLEAYFIIHAKILLIIESEYWSKVMIQAGYSFIE